MLAGTRDATVRLRKPGGTQGEFDPATGTYPVTPYAPYFEGPARIQVLANQAQEQATGEQEVSQLRYAVDLDHTVTGYRLEDECEITAMTDNGDLDLVDRVLIVEAFEHGSLHWQRRLICVDNLETQEA